MAGRSLPAARPEPHREHIIKPPGAEPGSQPADIEFRHLRYFIAVPSSHRRSMCLPWPGGTTSTRPPTGSWPTYGAIATCTPGSQRYRRALDACVS